MSVSRELPVEVPVEVPEGEGEPRRSHMGPLLGDADWDGPYIGVQRAMSRMCHTGVPIEDLAYIFGTSREQVENDVRQYGRQWLKRKPASKYKGSYRRRIKQEGAH